jgi:hypothetical protein
MKRLADPAAERRSAQFKSVVGRKGPPTGTCAMLQAQADADAYNTPLDALNPAASRLNFERETAARERTEPQG